MSSQEATPQPAPEAAAPEAAPQPTEEVAVAPQPEAAKEPEVVKAVDPGTYAQCGKCKSSYPMTNDDLGQGRGRYVRVTRTLGYLFLSVHYVWMHCFVVTHNDYLFHFSIYNAIVYISLLYIVAWNVVFADIHGFNLVIVS
jgi:hypothetical protein